MASGTVWQKSDGNSSPPADLPAGRYEWRFAVGQQVGQAAIDAFWYNKADTLNIDCGGGQTFSPVSVWQDADNDTGTNDLVILADVKGFWPQLIGVVLAAIGIAVALTVLLREIRKVGPVGQLAIASGALLLIALVIGAAFLFIKSKGASIGPIKTG